MAEKAVTAPDAPATPATPTAGETETPKAEGNGQDGAKLAEIDGKLREATERLAAAERERDEAREAAKREEAIRKGIQRETTAKLQEYARLRQQAESDSITGSRLDTVERLLMAQLEQTLDPETRAKVLGEIESTRLKRENEALKARIQQPARPAVRPLDAQYKRELKDGWFAEYDVDPQDSRIDWGADGTISDPGVWYAHVKRSFDRLAAEKASAKPNGNEDLTALIARQVEEATARLREEYDAKLTEATAEVTKAKADVEEAKRLAEEATKRKKGADKEATPPAATSRKASRYSEIPKDWMYEKDPAKKKEYQALINDTNYRDELLAAARKERGK